MNFVLILYPQHQSKVKEERNYLKNVPVSSAKPCGLSMSHYFFSMCNMPGTMLCAGTTVFNKKWFLPSQSFQSRPVGGRVFVMTTMGSAVKLLESRSQLHLQQLCNLEQFSSVSSSIKKTDLAYRGVVRIQCNNESLAKSLLFYQYYEIS